MAKRKEIDWEMIERKYRIGHVSIREIARQHDIQASSITRKAKKQQWQRDHSEEIRQRTYATLQSNSESNSPTRGDIDKAVQTNIEVIQSHRADIRQGRDLVALLSRQLGEAAATRNDLEKQIRKETEGAEGVKADLKRRSMMLKAISLPSHVGALRDLSVAIKNLIPLERQAFNIDESVQDSETVLKVIYDNKILKAEDGD